MPRNKGAQTTKWFFILLSALILFLTWQLVEPFAVVLATAAIAAIVLSPVDGWVRSHIGHPKISAILTVTSAFFVVLIPLFALGVLMVDQASEIIQAAVGNTDWLDSFRLQENPAFLFLPDVVQTQILAIDLVEVGRAGAEWLVDRLGIFVQQTAGFLFKVFFFFIAVYYFLSDRDRIREELLVLSPFKDKLDAQIIQRIVMTVRGTVFGALIVATIQAVLGTIGMTIFGVPGSLLWGSLIVISAEVPIFGVGLVMIPAVAYLLVTGATGAAIGLAIWSVAAVGLIDNFLSPHIVGGRTKMHSFLILIAILGGLHLFGAIGIVLGPTVLAMFLVVRDLYKDGALEG